MVLPNPNDEEMRALLERVRRIVVVGLSPKADRDSNHVARYIQERGYEIVPVYPEGDTILGAKVYRRVRDVPGDVDLVDVFRKPEAIAETVDDVLGRTPRPPALWLQVGCVDEAAARRAMDAGLTVVSDRCLMLEHAGLLGRTWRR